MKVNCLKKDLVKGINMVDDIILISNTLPILSNLLIETSENSLHMITTNLEVGMECYIPAQVIEQGKITVPAHKISEAVKSLPDVEININTENNTFIINYKKGFFRINGSGVEDFPELPQIEKSNTFSIKQTDLKRMIKKTSFAVSYDDARPALSGVLFVVVEDILRLIATDGRRMACIESTIKNSCRGKKEIIIPIKTINKLSKILDKGEVEVSFGENEISFQIKNKDRLVSRLINKQFPDYQKAIPPDFKRRVRLKNKEFFDNLKRVAVLTSEESAAVGFDVLADKIILKANIPGIGEVKEEVDLKHKEPCPDVPLINIIFEPRYIMDFLKNEESADVFLDLNGPLDSGVMKPDGDEKYTYVIMPIRP
ncbi:DNA polymerase III subunit beta [candidate division NPL-UPA2 bacterium Unc8]|uniref:Beta sliding clamp n=1 Tax=candidate division NPL-UPA2 bacterium Unc8 TaxID=1980939 RepID=A0A399FY02_UNCN2|nr:DNA polymerase III subunit beta [Bacillota bacterium]RII01101.1 MAG: DNA polymerase III subunit beta [candidate division NPL-UPA2 bacterium Unc8]